MYSTVLTISKHLLILLCLITQIISLQPINRSEFMLCTKPPGKSYGERIQELENSIVYKLDHPVTRCHDRLVADVRKLYNLSIDFFNWLILDDKEEIKYAQQFLKNGVPQIVTRNYTGITLKKSLNFNAYEIVSLHNEIRNLTEIWQKFRDPYWQVCYNEEEYFKEMIEKYEREGFPKLKYSTDDPDWPTNEEDYAENDPRRAQIIAEKNLKV